jgi:hypothetical protein
VLRIDDRRRTGEVIGRAWGRLKADGAFLGVRGGRVGLVIGGDALAEVARVGVGTPFKPDVNYQSVLITY